VDEVKEDVKALYSITKLLRARRFQEGSVSITQSKVAFALGANGLPTDIHFHEQREANQLVEELMLLANQTVAAIIATAYPQQALLRRHPQPLEKSLADLKRVCEATGLALTGTSSVELQRLMESVDASGQHPLLALLLRQQCAKAMQLAQVKQHAAHCSWHRHSFSLLLKRFSTLPTLHTCSKYQIAESTD
jgi:exoribonuclease R